MATNDINLPTTLLFIRVRKPYTITKQREKWTKEEHEKFLEAIKLYGRAWRRIREHIGTKTAVQIRSHAQKFFSKVDRESGTGKSIEIPPPRPKRKPLHPYPRKLGRRVCTAAVPDHAKLPESSSGTIPSFSEHESGSPVSVLSLLRSDTRGIGNICASPSMSDTENGCCSPTSSALVDGRILALGLETMPGPDMDPKGIDTSARAQSTSVKLFGRTLVVSNSDDENSARFQVMPSAGAPSLAHRSPCSEGYSCRSNAEVFAPLPFWNFFGSRLSPLPFTTTRRDKRAEREAPANATEAPTAGKENYSTGASTSSVRNETETETETETAIDDVDHSVEGQGDSASQVLRSCSATTYRLKRSRNSAFSPVEATNQYMSKELSVLTSKS